LRVEKFRSKHGPMSSSDFLHLVTSAKRMQFLQQLRLCRSVCEFALNPVKKTVNVFWHFMMLFIQVTQRNQL